MPTRLTLSLRPRCPPLLWLVSQRTVGHFDHDRKDFDQQVSKVVINGAEVVPAEHGAGPSPARLDGDSDGGVTFREPSTLRLVYARSRASGSSAAGSLPSVSMPPAAPGPRLRVPAPGPSLRGLGLQPSRDEHRGGSGGGTGTMPPICVTTPARSRGDISTWGRTVALVAILDEGRAGGTGSSPPDEEHLRRALEG